MAKRGDLPPDTNWRDLMEPTRLAARSLVQERKIDVMQKGKVLGSKQEYRGPIRLRLTVEINSVNGSA